MAQLNIANNITISDLIIGKSYSNTQINQAFGCSTQGGMNRSHATNSLVLFVKHNKSLLLFWWNSKYRWLNDNDLNISFYMDDSDTKAARSTTSPSCPPTWKWLGIFGYLFCLIKQKREFPLFK